MVSVGFLQTCLLILQSHWLFHTTDWQNIKRYQYNVLLKLLLVEYTTITSWPHIWTTLPSRTVLCFSLLVFCKQQAGKDKNLPSHCCHVKSEVFFGQKSVWLSLVKHTLKWTVGWMFVCLPWQPILEFSLRQLTISVVQGVISVSEGMKRVGSAGVRAQKQTRTKLFVKDTKPIMNKLCGQRLTEVDSTSCSVLVGETNNLSRTIAGHN